MCANVDLYSGLVYRMLGIPVDLFTPLFAVARMAGWAAHRMEELISGGRIIRPAYKSVSLPGVYTPITQRTEHSRTLRFMFPQKSGSNGLSRATGWPSYGSGKQT